jgi:hypothetical protein
MRSSISITSTKYCWGVKVKEDRIYVTCSTHRRGEALFKVLVGKPEGKRLFKELSLGLRIL